MASKLTPDERDRILELQRLGMPRNEIAREVGRSPDTVSRVVSDAGLSFERAPEVEAATRAKQIDNRAKRAALESLLLDDALRLREQLWEPALVYSFGGRDNTYEEHTLERPDFAGQSAIMRSVSTAIDRSVRLADVDKAATGAESGKSMIGDLFAAIRAATAPEPDDEG